jgi:predicted secreted hydrolase
VNYKRTSNLVNLIALGLWVVIVLLVGCEQDSVQGTRLSSTRLQTFLGGEDTSGFTTVTAPRDFVFPQDHGAHPSYRYEWWYFTGNLFTNSGRHFGFELTFFRFALSAQTMNRRSAWATNQVYMAHFALTDTANQQFYNSERFNRDVLGLAGVQREPFRVWLGNWEALGLTADIPPIQLRAADEQVAIRLQLNKGKPLQRQGNDGLSQKGRARGNASYYYSYTRLPVVGEVQVDNESLPVTGQAWMDREWSTSALDEGVQGWDWFALQLSDQTELMFYRLRQADGKAAPFSAGVFIDAHGQQTKLTLNDLQFTVQATWTSQTTAVAYPVEWQIVVPKLDLDLQIKPYLKQQELNTIVSYWEGAVKIEGVRLNKPIRGNGYVELTGY